MNNHRTSILIADDETRIRRILAAELEQSGFDVTLSGDGLQVLEILSKLSTPPDLIVLDLMMPELDGFEVLERIRRTSSIPVIILTALGDVLDKTTAFGLGADDYLTKPFSFEELLARVHALLRRVGQSAASGARADVLSNGPLTLCYSSRSCQWNTTNIRMSDIEFRLIWELMKHKGAILTHEALLRAVWGAEMIGELNTLRVAVARVRKKISDAGIEESCITNFSKVGYMMPDLSGHSGRL